MSDKESSERPVSKVQWALFIIAMLSLIVAFMGVNYQSISSYISSQWFPKADFKLESWATPTILPSDFRESLSASPEYLMVISVNLKSENPYQGNPLYFSISFENKGKKSAEQPRIVVYFVDYIIRAWNIWNESVTNDIITKGCSIEYHFPPLDQKIVGTWSIFVLLYDDAEGVLVSYALRAFVVTDVAPKPWWLELFEIFVVISGMVVAVFVYFKLSNYWEKRKKLKRTTKPKK